MEYSLKPKPKLTLSSTYNQLHSTLWSQKEKNYFFQKQNTILNTKISSIKQVSFCQCEKNFNSKVNKQKEDNSEEKQRLRQLYAQKKNQEQWIKEATTIIEQKNFERQYKRKVKIQKKLNKTNKKCKQLTKKLHRIQQKVDLEQNDMKTPTRFWGYYGQNENKKEIEPNDVLTELEKENQELNSLCNFKDHELAKENRKVKCINNEIIDLLALKNWMKKYIVQSQKVQNHQKFNNNSIHLRPKSSGKPQPALKIHQKTYGSTLNNRSDPSSVFRQQPKLKITTY